MTKLFSLPITYSKGVNMLLRTWLILGFLSVSWLTSARADLIVEVQDATILAGGLGVVDVYIRSTGTDLVNIFNLEFQITGSHPSGSLRFSVIQSNAVQQATDPDYIFLDASSSDSFGYEGQDLEFTNLIGGDQRTNSDTTVSGSNLLLARLAIEYETPTPLTASGVYQLSLVGANSFFADSASNFKTIQSSTSGTITVTSVPEPSSLVFLIGLAGILLQRRRGGPSWSWNGRLTQ